MLNRIATALNKRAEIRLLPLKQRHLTKNRAMNQLRKPLAVVCVLAIMLLLLIALGVVGIYLSIVSRVMTKSSPDGHHVAKL